MSRSWKEAVEAVHGREYVLDGIHGILKDDSRRFETRLIGRALERHRLSQPARITMKSVLFALVCALATGCAIDAAKPAESAPVDAKEAKVDHEFCYQFAVGFTEAGDLGDQLIGDFTASCTEFASTSRAFGPFETFAEAEAVGLEQCSGETLLDSRRGFFYFCPAPYQDSLDAPCLQRAGKAADLASGANRSQEYAQTWAKCYDECGYGRPAGAPDCFEVDGVEIGSRLRSVE